MRYPAGSTYQRLTVSEEGEDGEAAWRSCCASVFEHEWVSESVLTTSFKLTPNLGSNSQRMVGVVVFCRSHGASFDGGCGPETNIFFVLYLPSEASPSKIVAQHLHHHLHNVASSNPIDDERFARSSKTIEQLF